MIEILTSLKDSIARGYVEREVNQKRRGHLGASQIGKACSRELWYAFRWAARPDFSGRLLRLFQTGHLAEERLVADLRNAGLTVQDKDPNEKQFGFSDHGGHFSGSIDGVGWFENEWHLLEFKTCNDRRFQQLKTRGVQAFSDQHYGQMCIYMHYMRLNHAIYMSVNKNTDELYLERIGADSVIAKRLIAKAYYIITSSEPPARISEDPSHWECKFCGFSEICHHGAAAEANCRTCKYSKPLIYGPGGWDCACEYCVPDMIQDQKCAYHEFIDGLGGK